MSNKMPLIALTLIISFYTPSSWATEPEMPAGAPAKNATTQPKEQEKDSKKEGSVDGSTMDIQLPNADVLGKRLANCGKFIPKILEDLKKADFLSGLAGEKLSIQAFVRTLESNARRAFLLLFPQPMKLEKLLIQRLHEAHKNTVEDFMGVLLEDQTTGLKEMARTLWAAEFADQNFLMDPGSPLTVTANKEESAMPLRNPAVIEVTIRLP